MKYRIWAILVWILYIPVSWGLSWLFDLVARLTDSDSYWDQTDLTLFLIIYIPTSLAATALLSQRLWRAGVSPKGDPEILTKDASLYALILSVLFLILYFVIVIQVGRR